jgi:putative glutamine transport system permease protein
VPSIVSQLITLTKDTSLAAIIALQELTRKGQQLYQFNGNILETMFIVGMIYFVVCYILSLISSKLEVKRPR